MGRIPKPSPAMIVAIISLVVAIGGTAAALPGKFTVGRDDIKEGSIGARALGRANLGFGFNIRSSDPVENDGIYTETEGVIRCPDKSPFAMTPFVNGLGPKAYEVRQMTFSNKWGGPGAFRIVIASDEGPEALYGLSVDCLPSR